jgi:hypothetical protein
MTAFGPKKGGGGDAPEESFPRPGEPYGREVE